MLPLLAVWGWAQTFSVQPSLTRVSDTRWTVDFTLDRFADVTVAIVNVVDSTVVCHLAAGVLGAKAPAPFAKDSLRQSLVWDHKDDLGRDVTVPDQRLRVRVRAGLTTQLSGLIGGDPYSIGGVTRCGTANTSSTVDGIVTGPDGSVYIAGVPAYLRTEGGRFFQEVRKFAPNGDYVKTLFPPPGNLTPAQVAGWGVVNWPDGGFTPKHPNTSMPMFTTTIVGWPYQGMGSGLQCMNVNGDLVFGALNTVAFKTDGSLPGTGQTISLAKTPALPKYTGVMGITFLTPLRNGQYLVSGFFHYTGTSNSLTATAPDTSYYRDGKVYLSDPATGAMTTWTSVDSVPALPADRVAALRGGYLTASLQGTALDSAGHVLVCDRLHNRISVFDTNAVLQGGLPVLAPYRVAVSGRTGAVYVMTMTHAAWTGNTATVIRIIKFNSSNAGAAPVCTLAVKSGTMNVTTKPSFAVQDAAGQTTLWIGVAGSGVCLYRDNGASFSLLRDMAAESRATNELGPENPTPDRLLLDRRNGDLYISDSWWEVYKITDWTAPKVVICSTLSSAGVKKRLYGLDFTFAPATGLLYLYQGTTYTGPVTRYAVDPLRPHLHTPVNWANTGNNMLTPYVYSRWGSTQGNRGLAVAPDNRVALMAMKDRDSGYYVGIYPDSGSADTSFGTEQVSFLPPMCGGVKYDVKGNLYVGAGIRTSEFVAPASFSGDLGFVNGVGSVVKYNGNDTGSIRATGASNAARVYSYPLSPFSRDRVNSGCICRTPRFEVDPYGRLFLPSAVTCQVTVLDNDGNLIHQFGHYGNLDSRGSLPGLPSQEVVSGSDIPLAYPTSVAASEDELFVSDYINRRIARVRMVYAADNMPGFRERSVAESPERHWNRPLFTLSSGPVPFATATAITAALPDHALAKLEVLNAAGQRVKVLGQGRFTPGQHRFTWNGRDASGRSLAAGVYLYRFTANGRVVTAKTILAR